MVRSQGSTSQRASEGLTILFVDDAALFDIEEAAFWYESQRSDLGVEFILEIDQAMQRIEETPEAYREVYLGIRRTLVRRFPYAIYFKLDQNTVRVLAVLDQRRSDEFVGSRLE